MTRRLLAVSFALLLVGVAVGPALVAAAPSGFVNIPDEQITEDLPSDYSGDLRAADLRGSTLASSNASTTEVVVTTPDRAGQYLDGDGSVVGTGDVALVLRDDQAHGAREIALPADVFRDAFGRLPERVWGTHDGGERWSSPTRVEDGSIIFEVPSFSSNVVTFESDVSITAGDAVDGSQFRYNLTDLDAASDPVINLTGVTNSEWDNETVTDSGSISVGGNTPPSGPSQSDKPTVTVEAPALSGSTESHTVKSDSSQDEWFFTTDYPTGKHIESITMHSGSYSTDQSTYSVYVEGHQVISNEDLTNSLGEPISVNQPEDGDGEVKIRVYRTSESTNNDINNLNFDVDGPSNTLTDVTVSSDDGTSVSLGDISEGSTASAEYPVTTDATSLTVDYASGTFSNADLRMKETTTTENAGVVLNGDSYVHEGTLADGETVSITASNSSLVEGENVLNVTVGDGSLSSDAPSPSVGLKYTHTASDAQTVDYSATKWQESYNVSKTFGSARESASLSVPFDGSVVEVTNVEIRRGGSGSWSTIDSANYEFDGTSLTVDVGAVDGGEQVEVRATGWKVQVVGGSVDVVEPTVLGDKLNTLIEVTNHTDEFRIVTSGSTDRVPFAASESWTTPKDYAAVENGKTSLHLPAAGEGSTARVRASSIAVEPSGGIEVQIVDDGEPRFSLRPGDTAGSDRVEVEWFGGVQGETYKLQSITQDREVVNAEQDGSSVVLATGGEAQTYVIDEKDSSPSAAVGVGGGGDGGGGNGDPIAIVALLVGMAASILGTVYAGRRWFGVEGFRATSVVLLVGAAVGLVGVEAVTPRSVISDLIFGVTGGLPTDAGVVLLGASIYVGLYAVDSRVLGLPTWVLLPAGGLTGLWVVDSISGGILTGSLSEVGPLVWLIVLVGSIALLWRSLKGPTFKIAARTGGSR